MIRMLKGDMQWAVLVHTWAMGCWLFCAAVLLTDTRSVHIELLHSAQQNLAAKFHKTNCTVPFIPFLYVTPAVVCMQSAILKAAVCNILNVLSITSLFI
jgi:hypothetical protein